MANEFTVEEIHGLTNFGEDSILGRGGFSTVYKGRMHEQEVAVKVSLDANRGKNRSMWQAEVNWLQRLNHPNIVRLVGYCGVPGDRFFLVYEYAPGGTLEDHRKELNWENVLRVLRGVTSALLHIHSHGPPRLVYGDLKPQNILLREENEPMMIDFGTLTEENQMLPSYTMRYVDPNLVERGLVAKQTADIYSLGVLILQLITKKDDLLNIADPHARDGVSDIVIWTTKERNNNRHVVHRDLKKTGCSLEDAEHITDLALQCTEQLTRDENYEEINVRPTLAHVLETLQRFRVHRKPTIIARLANKMQCFSSTT